VELTRPGSEIAPGPLGSPIVTVVIPTHHRPQRLARLLDALRSQDAPAGSFRVVVVEDGASPPTEDLLDAELTRGELELEVIRNSVAEGPAKARNAGWRQARTPLIAFTDDDCVPVPAWLSEGLRIHEKLPDAVIQGPTEPAPDEKAQISLWSHTVIQKRLGPNYETCNIFYPRAVLESQAGFDESFGPRSAGEDTDLAWRALEAGHRIVFAPRAQVFHAVEHVGLRGKLRLAQRWTPCVRVIAEHPQTRVMLQRGVFWNVWHYLLLRALVSLAGPGWLRRLVLTRYVLQLRARGRTLGAGAWSVPFFLMLDTVETVAIVRGAIRYRTLVL
jgi:GT2 family glycosyltransferase